MKRFWIPVALLVALVATFAIAFGMGHATADNGFETDNAILRHDLKRANTDKAIAESNVTSLEASVTRLTDDVDEYRVENEVLKADAAAVASITPQSLDDSRADELITLAWQGEPAPAFITVGYSKWNARKTRDTLARWADKYGISGSEKTWLINKGSAIAFRESHHNPKAKNGDCLGLFQMRSGWGSKRNRLDGSWSCRRFVKCYSEGGKAALKRHWRATY